MRNIFIFLALMVTAIAGSEPGGGGIEAGTDMAQIDGIIGGVFGGLAFMSTIAYCCHLRQKQNATEVVNEKIKHETSGTVAQYAPLMKISKC